MSEPKANAQEDKECVSDSPGRAQEPLQSHTSSPKNNAAGLSSDEHENPLNGTQPNPFVYSSVPAVPRAGNSLPSGALVNGPGSHPTSEVHRVLNKGAVSSGGVPDAAWHAEEDTGPEVSPPPGELQSDARKRTAGPGTETPATQPGVDAPPSRSEENESKLACPPPSRDGARLKRVGQPLLEQTIKAHEGLWPRSPSDGYVDVTGNARGLARERVFDRDRRPESDAMHQRHQSTKNTPDSLRDGYSGADVETVDTGNKEEPARTQADIKYAVMPFRDLSRNTASDCERHIYSTAQEGCNEENDPEDESSVRPKVEQLETEPLERDPLFCSCTICNVNFKERRHFHRHMMYHLGKHNQVNSEKRSQPFICRECGRLFCDRSSLMRHIVIHRDRLEKLMKEIRRLKRGKFEDGATAAECPRCGFACDCPKIFVQRAKTRNNLKHYYFCQECDYITLTQQALEAHLQVEHLHAYRPRCGMAEITDGEEAESRAFRHEAGFFASGCKAEDRLVHQSKVARLELGRREGQNNTPRFLHARKSPHGGSSPARFGRTTAELSPSLWRIDKHGELLQEPVEKLDVATGSTCAAEDADTNDHEAFGSSKRAHCPASADSFLSARKLKLDQLFCRGSKNDPASGGLRAQANQNSPSMRRVSTPLHNAPDNVNGYILPRLSQRLKKQPAVGELERGGEGGDNFSDCTSEATGGFLESGRNERNPYARRYFRKRQSVSAQHQSPHAPEEEDDGDEDCSDVEQLIIKEEYVEAAACDGYAVSPAAPPGDGLRAAPAAGAEHRPCPYCPATFESGVGLSNHVRGHLHRVGLSYNARHMVPPEQVARQDRQPRLRRRTPPSMRKVRRVVKTESQGENTCPLCWGWFETRTGLSNHVRGHLKRIGRSTSSSSSSKSPLCILNELLKDDKEHGDILQVLKKSHISPRPLTSQKLSSNSLFQTQAGMSVGIPNEMVGLRPFVDSLTPKEEEEALTDGRTISVKAQRGTEASSSTLVQLLKTEREAEGQEAFAARTIWDMTKGFMEETQMTTQGTSAGPCWTPGGFDPKDICLQFSSATPGPALPPSLLSTYAHRKRIAIIEEPGYDYKQKKPRPRPGLKKKIFPSLNTEIYTLTCRFCDLIFQGPLSVQEDWIKHLQRHLLHTAVPHSGSGMVEVLELHHQIPLSTCHEHAHGD